MATSTPKLERILVGIDLSECSKAALRHALFLAAPFGASLDIIHVVWEPSPYIGLGILLEEAPGDHRTIEQVVRDRASAELTEFLSDLELPEGSNDVTLVFGSPAQALVDRAAAGGHDLIVIGTHGRSGLSRLALGSVAGKVLRSADCPVLVVRRPRNADEGER